MHRQEFLSHLFTCKFGGDLSGRTVDRKKPKTGKTYIRENAGQFASRQEKKEFKQKGEKRRRNLMVSALLILLAVLGVFKYADFVIDNMNAVFYAVGSDRELEYLDLLLPMGISFYTFQSLGYLLDVYWEKSMHRRIFSNICCLYHFSTTGTGTDQPLFRFITDVV